MKSRKAPQRKAAGRSRATAPAGAADAPFAVPKLQRNTLNEEVYEQLKQALMTGRIAPGSTMTIRSLAKSFGISPMPVREALRRLVASGTQLRAFPRAVLEAAEKASYEVYAEMSVKSAHFKRIYGDWKKFRDEQFLWFRVAEGSYDNYTFSSKVGAAPAKGKGK